MAHSHECIDLIYEILTGSLQHAPSILRQVHSFPVDVADPSTVIFKVDALRTVIHGHIYGQFYWHAMPWTECADAALDIMLDGDFCGYSQDELTASHGTAGPGFDHIWVCANGGIDSSLLRY